MTKEEKELKKIMQYLEKGKKWLEPYNTINEILEALKDYGAKDLKALDFATAMQAGIFYASMRGDDYPPIKTLNENHLNLLVFLTTNFLLAVIENENILDKKISKDLIKGFYIIENFNLKKVYTSTDDYEVV